MWRSRRWREGGDVLKDKKKKKALAQICVLIGLSPRHRMLYSHIGLLSWFFKAETSVGSALNAFDWSLFSAHQGLSVDSIDQTLHITYPRQQRRPCRTSLSALPWRRHCFGSCCTGDPTVNSVYLGLI